VRLARVANVTCAVLIVAMAAMAGNVASALAQTSSIAQPKGQNESSAVFKALYSGDSLRALQLAEERLKRDPRDVGMLVMAARAHLARNEAAAAYDALERALAIDSRNADALYFMGITSGELATRTFERLYARAPDSARVHQLMARSLALQGNPVEASAEYELALKAAPELLDALLEYARLRREQSDCAEAQRLYERAQRVKGTYDGAFGLGLCLAIQGEHSRAVTSFREALTLDPRSAAANFDLGNSLLRLGDAAGAVAALERSAQLAPGVRETYYVLGRAYQQLNQLDKAQQAFDHAAALARTGRTGEAAPKIPR
jgi:tetratricopeptide (TPR) repeat protein